MTALHPPGSDEEGQPRKDLWPAPEAQLSQCQLKEIPF